MANKPEQNPSSESGGHTHSSGLDLETKIFSPSGRGGTFFLTSLFIELTDLVVGFGEKLPVIKNVMVPCSERLEVEHNGSERISGKRFKNHAE